MRKQVEREQRSLNRRFRTPKHQVLRLMDELGMAIINSRPSLVLQKIGEKLLQLLQPPAKDVRGIGEQNMTVYAAYESKDDAEEKDQETSAKTIRALLSIVRMLTESGKIKRDITNDDIQRAAFKGTTFTEKEKMAAAKIVNFLRPFVQQRSDDNRLPTPHILTRAPLAALANTIAVITGSPSLVQKLSITPQEDSRALHLTAAGVYDAFREHWDIPVGDGSWITNASQAGKNKPTTFGAFFNTNRIESLVSSYGLQFAWRLTFVNKWTVRLLGKAKPGKVFVKSNYEARRKRGNHTAYTSATEMTHQARTDMEKAADGLTEEIKSLTSTLQALREELSPLELNRMNIGRDVRRLPWDPGSDDYRKLRDVRQKVVAKQLEVIKSKKMLVRAKSSLYSINNALQARPAIVAASTNTATDAPATKVKEDRIELVSTLWLSFGVRCFDPYHSYFSNADESTPGNHSASLVKENCYLCWNRSRYCHYFYNSCKDSRGSTHRY